MNETIVTSTVLSEHSQKIVQAVAKLEKIHNYTTFSTEGSSKGENFLGVISRVKIEGTKDGKNKTLHLILKTPPSIDVMREKIMLNEYYRREVYAYSVILPAFNDLEDELHVGKEDKFKSAKCYTASSDNLNEILVFEDLNVKGFRMFNRHESFDYDHMLLLVNTLAKYHALSFAMKEKNPRKFAEFTNNVTKIEDLGDFFSNVYYESVDKAVAVMEDSNHAERLKDYTDGSFEKLVDFLKLKDESEDFRYGVIGHGDCWCNNFLFKYEDNKPVDVILVDWQIIKFASPVVDLAYLVFTSTDEEFRSKHFDELMNTYFNSLSTRLSALGCDVDQCYPEEIFRRHLKKYLPSGLIWSLVVLPLTQGNKCEAVDLTDILDKEMPNTHKIIMSDNCVERLNGVVRDFVKYEMI